MASRDNWILNENDYQHAVALARQLTDRDKVDICPHFTYVFYADLEIYLNSLLRRDDRWYLIFSDLSQVVRPSNHFNQSAFSDEISGNYCDMYHNTKLKYHCDQCGRDWTTMQGQISFRFRIPLLNPPFILFADIGRQQCQRCSSFVEASCYLDEVTRIMKLTSRYMLETFYSYRQFQPEDNVQENIQRASQAQGHHQQHLCLACQQGVCWSRRRRRR